MIELLKKLDDGPVKHEELVKDLGTAVEKDIKEAISKSYIEETEKTYTITRYGFQYLFKNTSEYGIELFKEMIEKFNEIVEEVKKFNLESNTIKNILKSFQTTINENKKRIINVYKGSDKEKVICIIDLFNEYLKYDKNIEFHDFRLILKKACNQGYFRIRLVHPLKKYTNANAYLASTFKIPSSENLLDDFIISQDSSLVQNLTDLENVMRMYYEKGVVLEYFSDKDYIGITAYGLAEHVQFLTKEIDLNKRHINKVVALTNEKINQLKEGFTKNIKLIEEGTSEIEKTSKITVGTLESIEKSVNKKHKKFNKQIKNFYKQIISIVSILIAAVAIIVSNINILENILNDDLVHNLLSIITVNLTLIIVITSLFMILSRIIGQKVNSFIKTILIAVISLIIIFIITLIFSIVY